MFGLTTAKVQKNISESGCLVAFRKSLTLLRKLRREKVCMMGDDDDVMGRFTCPKKTFTYIVKAITQIISKNSFLNFTVIPLTRQSKELVCVIMTMNDHEKRLVLLSCRSFRCQICRSKRINIMFFTLIIFMWIIFSNTCFFCRKKTLWSSSFSYQST